MYVAQVALERGEIIERRSTAGGVASIDDLCGSCSGPRSGCTTSDVLLRSGRPISAYCRPEGFRFTFQNRARYSQPNLGTGECVLKDGSLGQYGGGKNTALLIASQCNDVVDRMLRYPHSHRRHMKGKLRGSCNIERTGHRWLSEKAVKGVISRNLNPIDGYIVAAGSSEP
jgi:hypothetical protein